MELCVSMSKIQSELSVAFSRSEASKANHNVILSYFQITSDLHQPHEQLHMIYVYHILPLPE